MEGRRDAEVLSTYSMQETDLSWLVPTLDPETPSSGLRRHSFHIRLLRGPGQQGPWLWCSVTLMPNPRPGPD